MNFLKFFQEIKNKIFLYVFLLFFFGLILVFFIQFQNGQMRQRICATLNHTEEIKKLDQTGLKKLIV